MTNQPMNDFITVVNHASQAGDRWWIAALFLLLLLFVSLAARWLISRLDHLQAQARIDQVEYTKNLTTLTSESNKTSRDLAVVLERCSTALNDNNQALAFFRETHKHP